MFPSLADCTVQAIKIDNNIIQNVIIMLASFNNNIETAIFSKLSHLLWYDILNCVVTVVTVQFMSTNNVHWIQEVPLKISTTLFQTRT